MPAPAFAFAQDAMSKTIPIWATVINRAVARVRAHDAQKELRRRSYSTHDGQVLAAVADTQDSISVRDCDGDASAAAGTAAAASSEHSAGAVPQQQQQQLMKMLMLMPGIGGMTRRRTWKQ